MNSPTGASASLHYWLFAVRALLSCDLSDRPTTVGKGIAQPLEWMNLGACVAAGKHGRRHLYYQAAWKR